MTAAWLILERQPPWWDDSFYLAKSLVMFDALSGGLVGYIKQFFSIMPNRPPLITVLPTPLYLVFRRDPKYAFGVNLVLIPVLLGSIYLLGKNFWGERAGLIADYIVGTMPMVYGLARWYLVEFSLTSLVALAIRLLVESRRFLRFPETLSFGIVCALGLLLKATFPVFVLPPFLYVFWRSFSAIRGTALPVAPPAPSRLSVISALAVPSMLLALPWYLRNFGPTARLVEFAGFSSHSDIYGTG